MNRPTVFCREVKLVKLATLVEGDPKAHFSNLLHRGVVGGDSIP